MRFVIVGNYYCEFCKKDISVRVYTDNPELVTKFKDEAIAWVKNYHWYDNHYNCVICGKWIPSGQRELIIQKEYRGEINPEYNFTNRDGLLRIHKTCVEDQKLDLPV